MKSGEITERVSEMIVNLTCIHAVNASSIETLWQTQESELGSYNTVADILSDSQTSAHTLGNEASD